MTYNKDLEVLNKIYDWCSDGKNIAFTSVELSALNDAISAIKTLQDLAGCYRADSQTSHTKMLEKIASIASFKCNLNDYCKECPCWDETSQRCMSYESQEVINRMNVLKRFLDEKESKDYESQQRDN